jgi:hypothetical protein
MAYNEKYLASKCKIKPKKITNSSVNHRRNKSWLTSDKLIKVAGSEN